MASGANNKKLTNRNFALFTIGALVLFVLSAANIYLNNKNSSQESCKQMDDIDFFTAVADTNNCYAGKEIKWYGIIATDKTQNSAMKLHIVDPNQGFKVGTQDDWFWLNYPVSEESFPETNAATAMVEEYAGLKEDQVDWQHDVFWISGTLDDPVTDCDYDKDLTGQPICHPNVVVKGLTRVGVLSQDIFSPDGKYIVFTISDDTRKIKDANLDIAYDPEGSATMNEIWIRDLASGTERLLVSSGNIPKNQLINPNGYPFHSIAYLGSPIFSLDGQKLFFSSNAWVTSRAIFSVDIETGKLTYVSDGNGLGLVTKGPYKGMLITLKHKYFGAGGSYDFFYIIDHQGKELDVAGDWDQAKNIITEYEVIGNLPEY